MQSLCRQMQELCSSILEKCTAIHYMLIHALSLSLFLSLFSEAFLPFFSFSKKGILWPHVSDLGKHVGDLLPSKRRQLGLRSERRLESLGAGDQATIGRLSFELAQAGRPDRSWNRESCQESQQNLTILGNAW
ncbi:unnamed protein product [Polarella glacialis]|uniref:Uncharacterized protein n=1 Tax=Polarella glacialis TaxID=89957 RepID=A0A813KYD3_POLGL|nr:unnamed protein product [Polarella glacialis]